MSDTTIIIYKHNKFNVVDTLHQSILCCHNKSFITNIHLYTHNVEIEDTQSWAKQMQ